MNQDLSPKMKRIQELMLARRWDEAYNLLLTVDDPLGRQWLATVEDMRRKEQPLAQQTSEASGRQFNTDIEGMRRQLEPPAILPDGFPNNPYALASWTFWLTPVVSAIGLSLNWRKLGRPGWTWPSILLSLVVMLVGVGLILGVIATVPLERWGWEAAALVGAGLGLILAYPYGVALSQLGGYRYWREERDAAAMLAHPYHFGRSILVNIASITLGAVAGILLFGFLLAPRSLDAEILTLQHPAYWAETQLSQVSICQNPEAEYTCRFVLNRSDDTFLLVEYPMPELVSAAGAEQAIWQQISQNPAVELLGRLNVSIDGREAVRRSTRVSLEDNTEIYVHYIYAVLDSRILEFTYSTATGPSIPDDVQMMFNSIRFEAES